VNDETQQPKQPASPRSRTRGGDYGRDDDYRRSDYDGRDRDGRPKADPILTRRFEALEKALHGQRTGRRPRALNWSGVDETAVTFQSIESQLEVPPDRPTSDLPEESDAALSGD
jgi:hypothetical protein